MAERWVVIGTICFPASSDETYYSFNAIDDFWIAGCFRDQIEADGFKAELEALANKLNKLHRRSLEARAHNEPLPSKAKRHIEQISTLLLAQDPGAILPDFSHDTDLVEISYYVKIGDEKGWFG